MVYFGYVPEVVSHTKLRGLKQLSGDSIGFGLGENSNALNL